MNILYHHRTQGKTVEGTHIRAVVNALRDIGHTVHIVSPPGIDPYAVHKVAKKKPGKRARVWSRLSASAPQFLFESMERLYNIYALIALLMATWRKKYDSIYERSAYFLVAGVTVARLRGIPCILEVNEITGIKRQRGLVFKRLAERLENLTFHKATAIIVVSSYLKKQIVARGIAEQKILVMPNGVNPEVFDPAIADGNMIRNQFGFENDAVVFGFVGSFSKWDKLEQYIEESVPLLKENTHIRLLLVGDGFNFETIQQLVSKLKMKKSIVLAGRVPRAEIPNYIAAMDAGVIPATNPFGSPVVMFEYMAMTKPVIVPDVDPILDVVTQGDNGIIFEHGHYSALRRAMKDLAARPDLRAHIGARARAVVLERHTWEHNARRVCALVAGHV